MHLALIQDNRRPSDPTTEKSVLHEQNPGEFKSLLHARLNDTISAVTTKGSMLKAFDEAFDVIVEHYKAIESPKV